MRRVQRWAKKHQADPPTVKQGESEADFSSWLEDLLTLRGWLWQHQRPAQTAKGWRTAISGTPGFPDIVACRGERLLFVELKSDKGTLSPEQRVWLAALGRASVERHVWRPRDRDAVMAALA